MIYFTGSKAHNIRIREMAVRAGLKLNEYGLFDAKSGELLAAETEEDVYGRLGMPYIEPTLREDRGEVEAALAGELPTVLHREGPEGRSAHPHEPDGRAREPGGDGGRARRSSGTRYFAITDHAPNLYMQRMTDDKILAQRERVGEAAGEVPEDDAAARDRAEHRSRRRRRLGRRVPGGLRPHGRVGPLPLQPVEGGDDRDGCSARSRTRTWTSSATPPRGRSGSGRRSTWISRPSSRLRAGPARPWRSTPTPTGSTCRTSTCSGRGGTACASP